LLDLLIANARLVDPDSGAVTFSDIHVRSGRISALVAGGSTCAAARKVVDAAEALVMPGLVDTHVHLTPEMSGRFGFRMLARAGVTTALDMAGPVAELKAALPRYGVGINLHSLESLRPGVNIADADPDRETLLRFSRQAADDGCFGIKILGGHYPLTPEATRRAIEVAAELGIHVAIHAGSTATRSDIAGLREAVDIAGDLPLHVAHVNSYCRGSHRDPVHEALEALALLDGRANLVSESYLSPYNANRTDLEPDGGPDGSFVSAIPGNTLARLGYTPDVAGLEAALRDGTAHMTVERGADMELVTGPEAWAEWQALDAKPRVMLPANSFPAQAFLATARAADSSPIVTALATDGGGIPRNDTLARGLGLVEAGLMPLAAFIARACRDPARRILRRDDIGEIAEGLRADLVIVDEAKRAARTTIYGGDVVFDGTAISPCGRAELNGQRVLTGG